MDKIKRQYTIKCVDVKDADMVANRLHEQLRGNEDYINSNIVLSKAAICNGQGRVDIYVFDECKTDPTITL